MKILCVFVLFAIISYGECVSTSPQDGITNEEASTLSETPTTASTTTSTTSTTTTTTTTPTTTTTTAASTTTSTPTTTSVIPTVNPDDDNHEKGHWNVTDSSNKTCILLDAKIRLEIDYNKTNAGWTKSYFDVPKEAVATGSCGNDSQVMTLTFWDDWVLTLTFVKSEKTYNMSQIDLMFVASQDMFPEINSTGDVQVTSMKNETTLDNNVDLSKAFRCDSETEITEFKTNATMPANLTKMTTWDVQVEAFLSKAEFGSFQACEADTKVNNLVPIIVGAALAGLVLIVLIAYLIGRRRNKRGYESV